MFEDLEKLQLDAALNFDMLIPSAYTEAWFIYERNDNTTDYWYCYIDKNTGNVIPADGLKYRKDVMVKDIMQFNKKQDKIPMILFELKKMYYECTGKNWYGCILQLNSDKTYQLFFDYEKHESSFFKRRQEWCMDHFGMIPVVKVDMLNSNFPGHKKI